ncbi:MAG: glycosyltransferase [Chlorobium sp.]|nr:MAG: glycosyltransferase family 4 protein [Chlorobium sp.]
MITVLGLALYGPLAASNRYRLSQYVTGLAAYGIDLQISHLLGDDYLRYRFGNGSIPVDAIFSAGIDRLTKLLRKQEYDIAMVHCELFPLLPAWIECSLIRRPYIYDFDDAFYLKYHSGLMGVARPLLGRKFERVIAGAAAVTAGNRVLANYALQFNTKTHLFPSVVDTGRYLSRPAGHHGKVFTVGWIGSPSTAPFLMELVGPLSVIGKESPIRFIVIGGKAPVVPNVTVVEMEWNEHTEIDLINSFDVGVMPLPVDDWARGKCAFKLIQYMACGVPVIASPVGANSDVITDDCGLMASTPEEWVNRLRIMRDDPKKRAEMGKAGRLRVEAHYSLDTNLPVLARLIRNVVDEK